MLKVSCTGSKRTAAVTFDAFVSSLSNRCVIVDSLLKTKAKYDIPDIA
jgi:hypothetical protein